MQNYVKNMCSQMDFQTFTKFSRITKFFEFLFCETCEIIVKKLILKNNKNFDDLFFIFCEMLLCKVKKHV